MNVKDNKRKQRSRALIEKTFVELLQKKEIGEITVSEIVAKTGLNRSTFYANYLDIYDLADTIRDNLAKEVENLYSSEMPSKFHSYNWLKLFEHIKENQIFYNTYFKLGYDAEHQVNIGDFSDAYMIFPQNEMEYHIEFFKAGFNAVVKKWLSGGCKETPAEMNLIFINEYKGRNIESN